MKLIRAKVVASTTVNNEPKQVGEIVEVDPNTFTNLVSKGRLAPLPERVEVQEVETQDRDPETTEEQEKADDKKGGKTKGNK